MKELIKALLITARAPRVGFRLMIVRQFVKFSIVGVLNTLTSFFVYVLMSRGLNFVPLVANAIAFSIAVTVSFFVNRAWTFRERGRVVVRQYSIFFMIGGVGLAISETVLFVLHHIFQLYDILAFLIAAAVVVFWNFSANRAWTFSSKQVA